MKKNKADTKQLKKQLKKEQKARDKYYKKPFESTQMNIPIKEISKGIICTSDNRYIKILEVTPINFMLISSREQNNVSDAFASLLKMAPSNLQFKVVCQQADIKKPLSILAKEMLEEKSDSCYQMQKEYAKLLKETSEREGVSRRFFLIYEYEQSKGVMHKPSFAEIEMYMNTIKQRIVSCLQDCGNDIIDPVDVNEQAGEILYALLNRKKSETVPFPDVIGEVVQKYIKETNMAEGYVPYIKPTEYIAPKIMDFSDKSHVFIDGKYYGYAFIPSGGYNQQVITGWLSTFINAGSGIDLDIFLTRVPKEDKINSIRRSIIHSRVDAANTSDTQANFETLNSTIQAGEYLKAGLSSGEEFYYMAIMVTICADTPEEVDYFINELKSVLGTSDILLQDCKYEEENAFISSLPLCKMDKSLWNKAKRNVLTSGASSTYPFTSFEMYDENGILLGRNEMNSSLALIDLFNTKKLNNANLLMLGETGSGKTFTLLLLAMRMRLKHIPCYIVSPIKCHEMYRVCKALGGQIIQFGAGSPHRINIMDIARRDETVSELIDGEIIQTSYLAEKIQDLKSFFELLMVDGITYEEKQLLDDALIEVYANKGITIDNETLIDKSNPNKYKTMPILQDLYEILLKSDRTMRMATIIKPLVTGSASTFNGQTNVDLDNEFIVLGLENLVGDMLPIGMYMAIDFIWSKVKQDRTKRKVMLVDEFWKFCKTQMGSDFLLKVAKIIRAYGGSLILASQDVGDLMTVDNGKYGEGILNACQTKIIMNLQENSADAVQQALHLTMSERDKITKLKKGHGFVSANRNNVIIDFTASPTEFNLITTDRAELEKQLAKKMSEQEEEIKRKARENEVVEIFDDTDLDLVEILPTKSNKVLDNDEVEIFY